MVELPAANMCNNEHWRGSLDVSYVYIYTCNSVEVLCGENLNIIVFLWDMRCTDKIADHSNIVIQGKIINEWGENDFEVVITGFVIQK